MKQKNFLGRFWPGEVLPGGFFTGEVFAWGGFAGEVLVGEVLPGSFVCDPFQHFFCYPNGIS